MSWVLRIHLALDLLFLIHLLDDFDGFSKLLCGLGFYIQPELGENGEERICRSISLQRRCTSSRRAARHLMRVLKSPFPRTFRSSQFVRTSRVVRSRFRHLRCTLVIQAQDETRVNALLFLVSLERNLVHASKEGNRVGSLDKVSSRTLLEQCVIPVFITVSSPAFLFGLEDIGLEVVGGCTLVNRRRR